MEKSSKVVFQFNPFPSNNIQLNDTYLGEINFASDFSI